MTAPLRVAVLWKQMSGYWDTCMRALEARDDVVTFLAYPKARADAPFDEAELASTSDAFAWSGRPGAERLRRQLGSSRPDVVMVSSWDVDDYRREVRRWRGRSLRVLCMDNQWLATPKQRLGVATAPLYLKPAFDVAYMPGDTQGEFARRLGFGVEHQLRGLYCADQPTFEAAGRRRTGSPARFLFVGRLVAAEGRRSARRGLPAVHRPPADRLGT